MAILDFSKYSSTDVISIYSSSIKELKKRNIIRTNNVVGELGEYLAIEYYKKTRGLPKLQTAPVGTRNIDAISINGDRYSIKATTGTVTGVFYGLEPPDSSKPDKQIFEYVIVVKFGKDMELEGIYEIDWDTFLKNKHWHSRMSAWNLQVSRKLIEESRIIYQNGTPANEEQGEEE